MADTPKEDDQIDYFLEEECEEGSPINKDDHSASQYSLSFGYGDETVEGTEGFREAEIVIEETTTTQRDRNY